MSLEEELYFIRSDNPRFHDPRYQRRIVEIRKPIAIIDNMFELSLECGHEPLQFGPELTVGELVFCPDCEADV